MYFREFVNDCYRNRKIREAKTEPFDEWHNMLILRAGKDLLGFPIITFKYDEKSVVNRGVQAKFIDKGAEA